MGLSASYQFTKGLYDPLTSVFPKKDDDDADTFGTVQFSGKGDVGNSHVTLFFYSVADIDTAMEGLSRLRDKLLVVKRDEHDQRAEDEAIYQAELRSQLANRV